MPNTVPIASAKTGTPESGFGIRGSGVGPKSSGFAGCSDMREESSRRSANPESRIPTSGRGADDAGAGETVVEAATIAADQRGHETEACGNREQHPDRRAKERAAQIERPGR